MTKSKNRKLFFMGVLTLALALAITSIAMAAVWTDKQDYSPGETVTIYGDNSDGAGYVITDTVQVDVIGPNGYTASCLGYPDLNGAWSCQVVLWGDESAVGSYSYTATGSYSGTSQSGTFTDAAAAVVRFNSDSPCSVSVNVTDFTNNGGQTHRSTSGSTSFDVGTLANTSVTFNYQSNVVCSGTTYNFISTSPTSPLTSGASSSITTVNGHYELSDTTAPTLYLPTNITTEATSASGAMVTFSATADDENPAHPTVTCTPASGSTFALGSTTVNCSATDAAGNPAYGSFTITVQDTTPPTIIPPANQTVEAIGPSGVVVTYSGASASDLVDGPLTPTCLPASGSVFPLGVNTVACSATDSHGNTGTENFSITVQDTTPPTIESHADVGPIEATGSSGASVSYTAPATHDLVDGDSVATCTPASGSTFALGDTTVTCDATDAHGNVATPTTFKVTVVDTTPPTIEAHADVGPIEATGPSGAVVSYTSPATHDLVDGDGVATCLPTSGSTFALGDTTVTCDAADAHGNAATPTTFKATVVDTTPPTITYVNRLPIANGFGWNNSDVIIHWSCTDIVGVVSATTSKTVSTEGINLSATGICEDTSENTASDTQTGINIDKTAPTFDISLSSEDIYLNGVYSATGNASDILSGVDTSTSSCGNVETSNVGVHSVTCTAFDKAGNTGEDTLNYNVIYKTGGSCYGSPGHAILQPINADGTSVFKQKSTVPAKFRLCDANGVSIGTPGVVSSFRLVQTISGTVIDYVDEVVDSTTPDTAFRWSADGQQWIFNINTKDLKSGKTYVYLITLDDSSTIQFQFGLK
jgi:hypothetical protein